MHLKPLALAAAGAACTALAAIPAAAQTLATEIAQATTTPPTPASAATPPGAAEAAAVAPAADTASEAASAPVRELGMVTVSGGRPTSLPTQIPTTIEGVTREQIQHAINATDSEDALKYLPSLLVRKRYIGD